jgi:hypothetical protein
MLYYTLDGNIDGNKMLQEIQKLLNKYSQEELVSKVLVIKLENITESNTNNLIPKLEYIPNSPT